MSTQSDQSNVKSGPSKTVMTGTVLWILAIIGLFFVWKNSNVPDPNATVPSGDEVIVTNAEGEEEVDEEEEELGDGKPQTITLNMVSYPFDLMDFKLTERSGKEIAKKDLIGKPWAVSFIFTRCAGPCYQITDRMAKLQKKLEDEDIRLVTITVDPKNDSPEVLKKYADAFQADPEKWLFLTGDQDKVYKLIGSGFKQYVHEETGDDVKKGFEVAHSSNIMLVSADGKVLGKYNGQIDSEMAKLRKDITKEADLLKQDQKEQKESVEKG